MPRKQITMWIHRVRKEATNARFEGRFYGGAVSLKRAASKHKTVIDSIDFGSKCQKQTQEPNENTRLL
ncbi:MAG TPA: hypothetical protein PK110_13105 [Niabella sp.]|jgi:hypothetical protein|nr:hypothetical protein [Chitinophagaceae bacterium]HRN48436.1 hypothetical protein [Niabella sp.]HRO85757.1 hypothetical protein [Niabella sp.]